jgi:formate dehydrogenase subunit gamma
MSKDTVVRYGMVTRVVHWTIALLYVLLFASGLALFHPAFVWLSDVLGGGTVSRELHPFLGSALAILFFFYGAGVWKENLLLPSDRVWLRNAVAVMMKRIELPVEGKYNAGQKVMFWMMGLSIAALLASGVVLWRPYFADSFGVEVRQIAMDVHAFSAFFMFAAIGIHVYAAFFTKGSIMAMLRGTVSKRWAQFHHPGWYRSVTASTAGEKETK